MLIGCEILAGDAWQAITKRVETKPHILTARAKKNKIWLGSREIEGLPGSRCMLPSVLQPGTTKLMLNSSNKKPSSESST